ncbi:unnamed protein product [Mytilus coruscus]|uniref:Uncharacterized protein n=1 Tax=Mytilus coruscus TaxID=42192 RepID=A0A6J8AAX9_MYTCO|nr:unnamed protein product [Mytilus coruscus]
MLHCHGNLSSSIDDQSNMYPPMLPDLHFQASVISSCQRSSIQSNGDCSLMDFSDLIVFGSSETINSGMLSETKLMAKAQTSTDYCQSLGTVVNVINHNSHKENNTPKARENNDNSTSTPKLMPGQNKEYTTPDRENNNSTSTPKLMPGQNKEYINPDEAFNALRSNERRINSMAIKQIVKNIRKLADLQTIDLSLIFCVKE